MLRRPPDRPDRLNIQAEVSQRPDDEGPIGKLMPERRVILETVRPVNDPAIGPDMGGASLRPINSGASLASISRPAVSPMSYSFMTDRHRDAPWSPRKGSPAGSEIFTLQISTFPQPVREQKAPEFDVSPPRSSTFVSGCLSIVPHLTLVSIIYFKGQEIRTRE
jgi:hypothetical protein